MLDLQFLIFGTLLLPITSHMTNGMVPTEGLGKIRFSLVGSRQINVTAATPLGSLVQRVDIFKVFADRNEYGK